MIDPTIFHDYDIRDVYPDKINEDVYFIVGRAIADYLKVDTIAVGRDCRLSSSQLFEALVNGIITQGVNVVDLGMISTEMHSFSSGKYNFPANVIVSASHNPPEYNGIKITTKQYGPLHGQKGLPEIQELAVANQFVPASQKGEVIQKDIFSDWIEHALSFVDTSKLKPIKVVVDGGNGMGGPSWLEVSKHLPINLIPLYLEPDGHFPNHLPDPLNERNLTDLKSAVLEHAADFGIAIDGDADRAFFLDENAQMLSGTIVTAILTDDMLTKRGPETILYNVIIGRVVQEVIDKHNANGIRVRVGHSFIKEYLRQYNAIFAGEHSGHYYFRENYYADSSLIPSLMMLQIISEEGRKVSEIVAEYDCYPQSGEINFRVPDRQQVVDAMKVMYPEARIEEIDGFTFWFDDRWFNVRLSKTEPLLRLNVEADNSEVLEQTVRQLSAQIEALGGKKEA